MAIRTKIKGVTYNNEDGTSRQDVLQFLSEGETLYLRDMYDEKYPEAIGVFNYNDEQCGVLSAELATSIREKFDHFESLPVHVLQVTGGGERSYGCNIEIDGERGFERFASTVPANTPKAAQSSPKKKKRSLIVVLLAAASFVLAIVCTSVTVYAIKTNQGGGALRAGAVSVVLFLAAALLITRKGRKP